jgi:zinc D-Ala-D-Ala dipeptidase
VVRAAIVALAAAAGGCAGTAGGEAAPRDAAPPPPVAEPPTPPPAAPPTPPPAAPPTPPTPLVDVTARIPDAVLDLRYATANNLTGEALYPVARCLLHADAAAALAEAASRLRAAGYRLILWDCYRPHAVQHRLWRLVPDRRYVAAPRDRADGRPRAGSAHSRAAAVDVSLADLAGRPLAMPTDHDHLGAAAHRRHRARDPQVRARVRALDDAMGAAGFVGLPAEWWHYALAGADRLPLLDLPLE